MSLARNQSCSKTDWLKLEKTVSFFLSDNACGRAGGLFVSRSVCQSDVLSVYRLVGRYVCMHTYVWSCVYICRQTDRQTADKQTACMHVCTDIKKEIFLIHTFIHTYIQSFCFTSCLSVRPFVCLSACVLSFCLPPSLRTCLSAYLPFCLSVGR